MATSRIYLQGGPCNGRTVSANEIVGGLVAYIKCQDGYYTDANRKRPNGNEIFSYYGKTKPGGAGDIGGYDSHALKGWSDVRKQINTGLPNALHRTDKLSRAALSQLRRHHKVRG